ncbi:FABP family protein [Propionibacteriaceae bacterium Y2011]|uniref:FABP family protein n=1 Tax=Microlunatus sp. Y2014 TaxID=3418488 RepID=UPI003B4D6F37
MIGRWEGVGKSVWPGEDELEFGQQLDIAQNGGNYLHFLSQTFRMNGEGVATEPLSMETGFWRPQADGAIEVVMCHPEGIAEIWYGKITGAKVELTTDAVARTATAQEYTAGQRLYGNVEGDLLWTFDKAQGDQPLQTHQWARLARTGN